MRIRLGIWTQIRAVHHSGRWLTHSTSEAAIVSVNILYTLLPEPLQRRLVGSLQEPTAIRRRVVNELPVIVFFLVVEFADRIFLAAAGHAYYRATAEGLTS